MKNWSKLKNKFHSNSVEENGRFYLENSATLAFKRIEEAFKGEAEAVGFQDEEHMQEYMKEIRKEVRGY